MKSVFLSGSVRGLVTSALLLSGLMGAGSANAVNITVSPVSQSGNVGDVFDFDITASDFSAGGDVISAFDFDFSFDNTVLEFVTATSNNALGISDVETIFSAVNGNVSELSFLFESELLAFADRPSQSV